MPPHYTFLIIGSGPAGCTAALYAARAGYSAVVCAGSNAGGQLTQTGEIENFPGFPEPILGFALMDRMQEQVSRLGVPIVSASVTSVQWSSRPFRAFTEDGTYTADVVILATGATARKLGIPGEEEFFGNGVSRCATCDGFFFRGKNVAIVGGGNTAVSEALFLANHAQHVTLIHRRDSLRAEKTLQLRLQSTPNISILWNTAVVSAYGSDNPRQLHGLRLRDTRTGEESQMATDGLFVAIGHDPQSALVNGLVDLTPEGYVQTTPGTTRTSLPGLFAAGDVADPRYRQAITAAAQGCMAIADAQEFLIEQPSTAS